MSSNRSTKLCLVFYIHNKSLKSKLSGNFNTLSLIFIPVNIRFALHTFVFFNFGVIYKDYRIQAVVNRLVCEVKALNTHVITQHIKGFIMNTC